MSRARSLALALPLVLLARSAAAQADLPPTPTADVTAGTPDATAPVVVAPPKFHLASWPAAPTIDKPAPDPPARKPSFTYLRVSTGLKVGTYGDAGLDTFASNDVIANWSIDASYTLFVVRWFSLAAGLGWDVGGRASDLRGMKTSITTHRFSVPIEGRIHFAGWLYAFGKLAPGAALHTVSVEEGSAKGPLTDTLGAFSGEASLGASLLVGPHGGYDRRAPRFWVTPEIGYGWTTSGAVRPTPSGNPNDVLGSNAPTNLGSLAMRGIFWRLGVAVTF
jgi:hypothetical protein